jgi:hypothetical protein
MILYCLCDRQELVVSIEASYDGPGDAVSIPVIPKRERDLGMAAVVTMPKSLVDGAASNQNIEVPEFLFKFMHHQGASPLGLKVLDCGNIAASAKSLWPI